MGARPRPLALAAGLLVALLAPVARPLPASAQQEDAVRLRLDAEEGQSATYRAETTVRLRPAPGLGRAAGMTGTTTSALTIRQTVAGVEDGVITYTVRVEDVQIDVEVDDPQMRAQLEQMARQVGQQVLGTEVTLAVSSRGEVVSRGTGPDSAGAILESAGALQRMGQSLRQFGFTALPEETVSVGQSWSTADTADADQFGIPVPGRVVTRTTTTLARLLRQPGGRVAELRVESTFQIDSGGEDQPMQVRLDGSSAGTVRFHVEQGRLLSSSGAQDLIFNFSVPGQPGGSGSVQVQSETRLRLVGG